MSLRKNLQSRFYETKIFKGLVSDYSEAEVKKAVESTKATIPVIVEEKVKEELALEKVEQSKQRAMQFRQPNFFNRHIRPDRKPGSAVPFSYMRRMAITYPIARACINRRITQITQLDWLITTADEKKDEKGFESQIKQVKNWLDMPMGHKTRFREMLSLMIDDILTVDAVCFEYQQKRGGEFMHLVPIDPTTIVLKVTKTGGTPEPPEDAYAQFIAGRRIAEFSSDELLYDKMRNRTSTPYGLAPLESLIIQTESAVRGALYNLSFFKEGNIPEGFLALPEDMANDKDQVEEWQLWFDSIMAGDLRMARRLKILPGGSEYTPVKKPEDMSFERFEIWLLQQTCAVFDVPPRDIGITMDVNKASDATQQKLSLEKGLIPLANFIKEVIDGIIHDKFGFEELQFEWTNLNPVDRKEEVDIIEKEIKLGVTSVDEVRMKNGVEPIGLGPYIMSKGGPILVKDFLKMDPIKAQEENKDNKEEDEREEEENPKKKPANEEKEKAIRVEIKKWRKCVYRDIEEGQDIRINFGSDIIPAHIKKELKHGLKGVTRRHQAKLVFDRYLDQELETSFKLLKMASRMRRIEDANLLED